MDDTIIKVSLFVIGTLLAIIGAGHSLYIAWQVKAFKRLEEIDTQTRDDALELKDRIGVHIGDSTYRFEVIQERLTRLEKTQGDHDLETGCLYLRRRYDSPKLLSTPPKPPRKPKPP